jgi:hypothetical protein
MHEKLEKKTEESINKILEEGITTNNLDHLYKLTKINHIAKEGENDMNYGNYGNYGARRPGYDSYGRDNYGEYGNYGENYGRRGRDMRYRGDDYMDRMSNEYGRYMETRERYGAGEESDKAFHFMAKALGEYLDFLHEEADTPQKKQMLNETLQRSMR